MSEDTDLAREGGSICDIAIFGPEGAIIHHQRIVLDVGREVVSHANHHIPFPVQSTLQYGSESVFQTFLKQVLAAYSSWIFL